MQPRHTYYIGGSTCDLSTSLPIPFPDFFGSAPSITSMGDKKTPLHSKLLVWCERYPDCPPTAVADLGPFHHVSGGGGLIEPVARRLQASNTKSRRYELMIRLGISTRFLVQGEGWRVDVGTLRGSAVGYFRTFNCESCFWRCARYEVAHEKCCPCPSTVLSTQTASCRSRLLAIHLQTARGAVERPLRHRCYQKGSWYLWVLVKICVCVRFCIQVLILSSGHRLWHCL
jgi:hypothetical protein